MPCFGGEAGARLDEAGVAFGDRDGESRPHERARAGRELDPLGRREVEAGVAGVRARRQRRGLVQPRERELAHATT